MKLKLSLLLLLLNLSALYSQSTTTTVELDSMAAFNEDEIYIDYPKEYILSDSLLEQNYSTKNETTERAYPDFRKKYQDPDFNYTTIRPKTSLMNKIENFFKKIIEAIFGKMDPNKAQSTVNTTLKILAILITGTLLYFLLRYLANKNGNLFFGKRNKKLNIPTSEIQENIHEINFEHSILNFENSNDYRSAIRHHFLFVLKKLSDKKLINWNPEKTNYDYLHSLKKEKQQNSFRQLIYIFENVWYGEFSITKSDYEVLKKEFQNFEF